MLRIILFFAGSACFGVLAQQADVMSRTEGTWDVVAMIGPRDSVVARYDMIATRTRDGWTVNLPNRPPLPARILTTGGDSVVFEIGPFASILRAGTTVTTRTVAHYQGDSMTGTIIARFSTGDSLVEKAMGKRRRTGAPS